MPQACPVDEHLTAKQVAAWLGVTVRTVRTWARRGRIPCLRISRRVVRFRKEDIRKVAVDRAVSNARDHQPDVHRGLRLVLADDPRTEQDEMPLFAEIEEEPCT